MDAAIAWLVQTILATLLIDKLDAWIRQVGLADDVEKLKSEIRRVKMVVSAVKERGIRNESLDESLALLVERLYEADDVVDELDYCRLQELVEGARPQLPADPTVLLPSNLSIRATRDEPAGMHGAEQVNEISGGDDDTPSNSVGKSRSVVWAHFTVTETVNGKSVKAVCRHCLNEFNCDTKTNGTSSMKKHLEKEHPDKMIPPGARPPNPSSTAEPIAIASSSRGKGRKRRSKAWDNFDVIENDIGQTTKAICKYCRTEIKCGIKTGTAGMLNHNKICKKKPEPNDQPPNPSSIGDATANATSIVVYDDSATRKRRRVDEESAEMTAANTHTCWDKATLSNMIRKIVSQLQEIQGQVREVIELHGSYLSSSSSHHQNATIDQNLRTSSLGPKKVYGRVAEKNFIIKMITEEKYDGVVVLPIVGIAGVGKTTLAQLVYNDPDVQRQFDQRIWIWVSRNFDEVRLTREMLNSISGERHEEINCFVKLQEILKSHANSMRLLIILDNVWDDMNDIQWDKMLAPLVTSHVILVTTISISVAQRLGTLKPVKLGALANDDRWSLFKSRAFGFEKYEDHQSLSIIGQQIAEKLKGNPLAVVSTGELLRKKLSTEYCINILKNEDWKSMQLSGGIMAALKLSYDQLPYHLQQCFSYCSIFPNGYQFLAEELIGFWISQGFVKCSNSSQRLEDIGRCYLIDLVNMGFFEEVKREEPYLGSQVMYAICGLMHDFALMVSRTDCASIDNLECNKMPRTLRHLSIVTSSIYKKDQHGGISREQKFEGNLRNAIKSVRKLRTLVLLGHYDSSFLQLFEDIFREAYNLRLLHMSTRSADFLKVGSDEVDLAFPQVLSKLYHLRVLNVGSYTDPNIPDSIDNLVSLRRLVLYKGVYTSIATIGNMTSLQELHDLKFQISSNFEIIQPELDNFKTLKEIYEVVCKRNKLLEKLHLSGKESSAVTSVELLTMDGSGPSSEPSLGIAREVFESLKSCQNLKILQISGYSDAKSSIGLASNISFTSLLSLQLYGCGEWQKLPSLERFSFLTKLKLSNLQEVTEILVPSLEELVLFEMPKLERCSCTSVEGMNSSLRALQIEDCQALIEFDLFENNDKFEIELRPWLPGLRKLTLRGCPHLKVLDPLPPSSNCCELLINGVSALPYMEGSSSGKLRIGYIHEDTVGEEYYFDESSDELRILDDKILAFHNLRDLKLMQINGCQNLRSFWFEGFSHLVSLKSLTIQYCEELFSSDVMQEHIHCAFPSLKSLGIFYCGIEGKWLSLMLEHAPGLEELTIDNCTHITTVLLTGQEADEEEEEEENGLSYLISARDRHLYVPLNYLSSLMEISVRNCPCLTLDGIKEGFSAFTSLKKLDIWGSPAVQTDGRWLLPTSLGELDIYDEFTTTLQPYFSRDITSLKKLTVLCSRDLESLWLHSCTALENLTIEHCESLTTLEGLQSLGRLRHLAVYDCPDLAPWLQSPLINQAYGQLFSRMETLAIDVASVLTTSFCMHLTSLQRLKLTDLKKVKRLTDEQERALLVLKSLQEIEFYFCSGLTDLPAGLHNLPSLKSLKIRHCSRISRLMETCLPRSLEELEIYKCKSLTTLEGLTSLGSLRHLAVYDWPVLPPWQLQVFFGVCGYDQLFCRLETLETTLTRYCAVTLPPCNS